LSVVVYVWQHTGDSPEATVRFRYTLIMIHSVGSNTGCCNMYDAMRPRTSLMGVSSTERVPEVVA